MSLRYQSKLKTKEINLNKMLKLAIFTLIIYQCFEFTNQTPRNYQKSTISEDNSAPFNREKFSKWPNQNDSHIFETHKQFFNGFMPFFIFYAFIGFIILIIVGVIIAFIVTYIVTHRKITNASFGPYPGANTQPDLYRGFNSAQNPGFGQNLPSSQF